MPLDHFATPSAEAEPFLDALADLCDHYGVAVASRYAELSDPANRVHYLTAGEGPPLLLLHGLGSTAHVWIPLFDALTDRFTVYAPDRPGRGLSTAVDYRETGFREFGVEYVVDLLDELGVEKTAVMGNSLGGFQSLALAVDHPEGVDRLCAIGAPAGLSRSMPPFLRLFYLPVVGDLLYDHFEEETVPEAREGYRQLNVGDDSALPDAYFEVELVGKHLPGQRESLRSLTEVLGSLRGMAPEIDLRGDLESVEIPSRFVWGTEDYFWEPEVGRPAVERMHDAELVALDDHGHMPWLEPGDAAERTAVEFLTGWASLSPRFQRT